MPERGLSQAAVASADGASREFAGGPECRPQRDNMGGIKYGISQPNSVCSLLLRLAIRISLLHDTNATSVTTDTNDTFKKPARRFNSLAALQQITDQIFGRLAKSLKGNSDSLLSRNRMRRTENLVPLSRGSLTFRMRDVL
jgi:hypothetical protein